LKAVESSTRNVQLIVLEGRCYSNVTGDLVMEKEVENMESQAKKAEKRVDAQNKGTPKVTRLKKNNSKKLPPNVLKRLQNAPQEIRALVNRGKNIHFERKQLKETLIKFLDTNKKAKKLKERIDTLLEHEKSKKLRQTIEGLYGVKKFKAALKWVEERDSKKKEKAAKKAQTKPTQKANSGNKSVTRPNRRLDKTI